MAFEDILTGLPSLEQPYARLPRRGPSRVSVRRIAVVLHGDRSDHSTQEVQQGASPRATQPSVIVCWPVKGINTNWRLRWGRESGYHDRFFKP